MRNSPQGSLNPFGGAMPAVATRRNARDGECHDVRLLFRTNDNGAQPSRRQMDRPGFLSTVGAGSLGMAPPIGAAAQPASQGNGAPVTTAGRIAPLKISSIDIIELHCRYELEGGRQAV